MPLRQLHKDVDFRDENLSFASYQHIKFCYLFIILKLPINHICLYLEQIHTYYCPELLATSALYARL